ncbi:MAG: ATP-binding protein [Lachnobacterium sp.]|nr:ATP-binding protein [uncultured Agathobacter sp.]MCI7114294.1 ATP-binding protein [Lachnobacterium sp.]
MKKKINLNLIVTAIFTAIITMICMNVIYFYLFDKQVKKDLRNTAQTLQETGVFNKSAKIPDISVENMRITWIDTDGTVLYDNENDETILENHLNRPEVKEAISNGEGDSDRQSATMDAKTYYHAILLDDGTILRVSTSARSIMNIFVSSIPSMLIVMIVIAGVCVILANKLTKNLMAPIEKVSNDLENAATIQSETEYKELVPFLNTIRLQHESVLAAVKSRQDFTANVSHELKTPLTAISGYAELIENNMVDEKQRIGFAGEIRKNADRLVSLINDIIRLSELDHSDDTKGFEQVDLCKIAKECVDNLGVSAAKQNIQLNFDGTGCKMHGNSHMLVELVENLCQNAIRYNNPGGTVNVTVHKLGGKTVLTVEDNGIGIPKDQQERVFERFYRVDKSRSKETGGTGLGLAIVKHIVELHDAKITLDSEVGHGTTIKVEF